MMDMIECAFLRSEAEVTAGKVLDDDEIVERLRGLRNFHQFSWWQIIQSVWAASSISRPILERFGSNVPIRVQQILIPMIAVGLCYGVELDVIKMVANYVVSLLAARSDYIEINGRRYPRTPVALSDYPVSDGGGYHALWGDPEGEEVKGRADSTAAPSADASVQTPQAG